MLKLACYITGDDYHMLKAETVPSRKKVVALAIAVFIPTIMWFITGFLIVYCIFNGSLISALISGLVAGSLIFIIERLVVMSSGSNWLIAFRIALAFLVAALGSIFLDEVIFEKDINQQLVINMDKRVEHKKSEIADKYKADMADYNDLVNQKHETWLQALNSAASEADGSTGSGIKGVDVIAKLKIYNAGIIQQDYENAKAELEQLQVQIKDEQSKAATEVNDGFESHALLQRIKAMFDLVKSDGYMMMFYLLITFFLFTLEFLVVVFKITMVKTNYERRLELIEEIGQKRMERVRQNDLQHFDVGRANTEYVKAYNNLGKSKTSIFN